MPKNNQKNDESNSPDIQTPENALNKAVVRTFKGDIQSSLGSDAEKVVDSLVPKKASKEKEEKKEEIPRERNKAIVHTYSDDVKNLVLNKKMSMVRMAALEGDRKGSAPIIPKRKSGFLKKALMGLMFVALGSTILAGGYYAYILNEGGPQKLNLEPAMFFVESRERIDIEGKNSTNLLTLLAAIRHSSFFTLGSVTEFYITQPTENEKGEEIRTHLTVQEFLTFLNTSVSDAFIGSLEREYMIGMHVTDDENVPFLVLKTNSYGVAYAGMLEWEKNIESNLSPFFSPEGRFVKPAINVGGSQFTDTVIENADVRILRDSSGDIRLFYSFIDRGTIVITSHTRTLREVINRFRSN
ncbi:hypothetical protein COB52_02185 [Candidatus Kaiserbacteria bacterium]|nr:MAG: hypothetical protein COB52_02185 [Candidatus Kaiserbacteria bacterium]